MKILIAILIVIAAVVGILAIVPAFIDEDVKVTRSIEIEKPVEMVYNITKNYEYYKQWNAWSQMDKDAVTEITGPLGEVGSSWSWAGDTVGTGSLTIQELVPNESIISRLEFVAPWTGVAKDVWQFEALDSTKTKVVWSYEQTQDSYMMRYMNLAMDGMLGPQLDAGLNNLKTLIEAMPDSVMTEVDEVEM